MTKITALTLTLAALVFAALTAVTATPAHATRIVLDHDYPDLCRNRGAYAMPGVQSGVLMSAGYIRFVDASQEPNRLGRRDCEAGVR